MIQKTIGGKTQQRFKIVRLYCWIYFVVYKTIISMTLFLTMIPKPIIASNNMMMRMSTTPRYTKVLFFQQQRTNPALCFIPRLQSHVNHNHRSTTTTTTAAAVARTTTVFRTVSYNSVNFDQTKLNFQSGNKHSIGGKQSATAFSFRSLSSSYFSTSTDTSSVDFGQQQQQQEEDNDFFANHINFSSMGIKTPILIERLEQLLQLQKPTTIQAASFAAIAGYNNNNNNNKDDGDHTSSTTGNSHTNKDLIIGAETGTGKTLAYLLPLMDDILQRKELGKKKQRQLQSKSDGNSNDDWFHDAPISVGYEYARALILVPNKELVQQVVRMAIPLAGGPNAVVHNTYNNQQQQQQQQTTGDTVDPSLMVRIGIIPGGLKDAAMDYVPFRSSLNGKSEPIDLLISTPAAVGPLGLNIKNINMFIDIETLVCDEADMLLDGGYIRPLQDVFLGFKRADRQIIRELQQQQQQEQQQEQVTNVKKTQYIFVAATLPDYGLRSVDAYIQKKFPKIVRVTSTPPASPVRSSRDDDTTTAVVNNNNNNNEIRMHHALHYGLRRPNIWLNVPSKKERMKTLVRMLVPSFKDDDKNDNDESNNDDQKNNDIEDHLYNDKVIIFLNSVEDVDNACMALNRISGIEALRYHAKMSLDERTVALERYRQYNPNASQEKHQPDEQQDDNDNKIVLVCTDLASRGLDVPGVTAVVQLQFATNVVTHLHRMGRCGRAGKRTGRGIIFYDEHDNESELVHVIQTAERMQQQQQQQTIDTNQRLILSGDVLEIDDNDEEADDDLMGLSQSENTFILNDDNSTNNGKVQKAFSRKRGFTKKLKKLRKSSEGTD